jgi:transcriptional regulator with XRE-family HTH domain
MKKQKLIEVREAKGLTQQQVAEKLCIDASCYNRRESGQTKIRISQWAELAKILDVPLENIHEEDEKQTMIFNDNAIGSYCANNINNINITVPETLLETQQKYIRKLEDEIKELKQQLMKK